MLIVVGVRHMLLPLQEAAVVAELPLPPELERLYSLFLALNGVHSFMLCHHIQVCDAALLQLNTLVPACQEAAKQPCVPPCQFGCQDPPRC